MIYLEVRITYRDDKQVVYKSFDHPVIGDKWITLYPLKNGTERLLIPNEAIAEIHYAYKCSHEKQNN